MTGFKVQNRSHEVIKCAISNKTGGSDGWYEIQPGGSETWERKGWEEVTCQSLDGTHKKALWINRGDPATVHFDGWDKEYTVFNDYRPDPSFKVNNLSPRTIMCFVSTNSGGSRGWFPIRPGESEEFTRNGYEAIGVKSEDDEQRMGVFFDNKGVNATVDFQGFDPDEGFVFHPLPSKNFIAEEHFAEAILIADRSHAAQSSRASTPGGLTASIYKIDKLEYAATKKKSSLGDHIQIYTLALLINHVKYGLAEPAVVVSVTPEWVKVAAYTCEFDAIVVLGFPTAVVDLIAPGKIRPAVGQRLLVVSQFAYRANPNIGVQEDITQGPRTYDKWQNFMPLVAQFVTPDEQASIWEEKVAAVPEALWGDIWEYWLGWKARHGESYFRLGAPSKIKEIATQHTESGLPPYAP